MPSDVIACWTAGAYDEHINRTVWWPVAFTGRLWWGVCGPRTPGFAVAESGWRQVDCWSQYSQQNIQACDHWL